MTARILHRAKESTEVRADDNEEAIKIRLATFRKNTNEIMAQYQQKTVVVSFENSRVFRGANIKWIVKRAIEGTIWFPKDRDICTYIRILKNYCVCSLISKSSFFPLTWDRDTPQGSPQKK